MLEVSINIPEIKEFINDIAKTPGKLFEIVRYDVKDKVGEYFSALMNAELTFYLGRDKYKRQKCNKQNYRNGSYKRSFTLKSIGEITVSVPRDRNGAFKTSVLPKSRQYEDRIREDLSLMFLSGISTRTLGMLTKRLVGRRLSHEEVSKSNRIITEGIESWRTRDLSAESIKYLFLDGVNFDMRIGKHIKKTPVLAAIGVNDSGHKKVLNLQTGDKESAANWREFFKDLKKRGLDGSKVKLGIMDGLPGLEKVFKEEFPEAKTQRCQVHVTRNVLAKVTRANKEAVLDDIRSIFYASSKKKALEFYKGFQSNWEKDHPSAVKCLDSSINSCLTFFSFPKDEWGSLRTTNLIERLNKEFKRRTKSMEIVAGETSCYRLLAFISLKMEVTWRSKPIGKGKANDSLMLFDNVTKNEFTQKS